MKTKKAKKNLTLPWWIKIFAYIVSVVLAGVSLFFIIVKGIEFGDEKAQKWLTSIFFSVLTSLLLTQPIQIAFMTAIFVFLFKKSNDENDLDFDYFDNDKLINENFTNFHTQVNLKTSFFCK